MAERIIREPEAAMLSGLSTSTVRRLEKQGKFPRRRRLSPNTVGWLESELGDWMLSRVAARDDRQSTPSTT